jgi:hypothetical protein
MLVLLSELLEYLCVIHFYVLSLFLGLGRKLAILYVMLSLLSLGLTMGIG